MGLRSTPWNAAATWRMLLQLQKHLQTEKLAPYGTAVRSHVTKTGTDIKNLAHTEFRYCSVVPESMVICQLTLKMQEIDFKN